VAALAGIDLPSPPVSAPRLGVVADPELLDCSAEVSDAYRAAIDALAGAELVEIRLPNWDALAATAFDLQGPEAAAVHADLPDDGYQPDVRERLRVAAEVPGWRYVLARDRQPALTAELGRLLSTVDAILLPTVPIVAPPIDAETAEVASGTHSVRDLLLHNNRPVNVTGYPALSLPIPTGGLPVGIQLIASDNARAFAVAEWVERDVTSLR
jgi:aspartyl-tRNA(Asn)/glutamyl-tRNA(Gln) amidotransferase subunit A